MTWEEELSVKKPIDVADLFPELSQICDEQLRGKVVAVWDELWQQSAWDDINAVPTSTDIPYPHVPHNRSVVAMALAVADTFERIHGVKLNRDYLIAGALLQDASKLVEYRPGPGGGAEPSDIGRAYPHAFWGAHVAIGKGLPTPIVHIILNHTPTSVRFPDSLEGKILYYVDQLDVLAIHTDRWRKELFITK